MLGTIIELYMRVIKGNIRFDDDGSYYDDNLI